MLLEVDLLAHEMALESAASTLDSHAVAQREGRTEWMDMEHGLGGAGRPWIDMTRRLPWTSAARRRMRRSWCAICCRGWWKRRIGRALRSAMPRQENARQRSRGTRI